MLSLDDVKQEAVRLSGTEVKVGTLRVCYRRWGRDASPKETPRLYFYRWDAERRRHFDLTADEAADLLRTEQMDTLNTALEVDHDR